jgi:hypothetical protein
MMVFDHPSHVQIIDGYRVELSHDLERRFVVMISALEPEHPRRKRCKS